MKLRNKKTGEIFNWREDLMPFGLGYPHPKSLAELCNDWEDVKEPLIKAPKIRKAVRAWAEASGAWLLLVVSSYRIEISQVDAGILFNDPVFKELPRDRQLTVTELCGEEEE